MLNSLHLILMCVPLEYALAHGAGLTLTCLCAGYKGMRIREWLSINVYIAKYIKLIKRLISL